MIKKLMALALLFSIPLAHAAEGKKTHRPWLWYGSAATAASVIAAGGAYKKHPQSPYAQGINWGIASLLPVASKVWSHAPARDSKVVKIMGGTIALGGLTGFATYKAVNAKQTNPINWLAEQIVSRGFARSAQKIAQEEAAWQWAEIQRKRTAGTDVPFNNDKNLVINDKETNAKALAIRASERTSETECRRKATEQEIEQYRFARYAMDKNNNEYYKKREEAQKAFQDMLGVSRTQHEYRLTTLVYKWNPKTGCLEIAGNIL